MPWLAGWVDIYGVQGNPGWMTSLLCAVAELNGGGV